MWLSQPARNILDSLERSGAWVFGSSRHVGPRSRSWPATFWFRVRAEAGLADVRLHDLRHTHASVALKIVAFNIHRIGLLLRKRARRRRLAA